MVGTLLDDLPRELGCAEARRNQMIAAHLIARDRFRPPKPEFAKPPPSLGIAKIERWRLT
jgi:hypothetical protein